MRILSIGNMYPPHHLGGYELMWQTSVRHLRTRGHSVRVLTTDYRRADAEPDGDDDLDVYRELRWYWRDHEFPRLGPVDRLTIERDNNRALRRHLREYDPEVVAWWALGGMSVSLVETVRRAGLPAVGLVHDDWMLYGPEVDAWHRVVRRLGPARSLVEYLAGTPAGVELGDAAEWLFVSETTRRRALESGWHLPRTGIAHSGIDPSLFPPAPETSWEWRLACVGRIDPRKGIEVAIEALRHLPRTATLSVVGGGDERHLQDLKGTTERLGLTGRVSFSEASRPDLRDTYTQADVFVFPVQWEEPWGLTPLEAMSVGTPVVATGTGGSSEYLRHGENCLLYSPRSDPLALASAVRSLADDPPLRARLRLAGFRTASRYTEDMFNEAVERALRKAVES